MTRQPIKVGLVGTGRIGRNHAEILALHTPGVELTAVADPDAETAAELADRLGVPEVHGEVEGILASDVDAVVVTAPSTLHAELIRRVASAGKAVFCEKPAAMDVAELDRALAVVEETGVLLQVGFNRRFAPGFAAAREAIDEGRLGAIHLLRSNTRDPLLADPAAVAPWSIFTQTLIHDFDALNWLNPGAEPVRVFAQADALVRPDHADRGLLDTALVTVTYSNGAMAMADASLQAVYGYDVRGEVFGSAGMATLGHARVNDMTMYGPGGVEIATSRSDTELLQDSYRAEFAAFAEAVRGGRRRGADGSDARRALTIARAAIDSYQAALPIDL